MMEQKKKCRLVMVEPSGMVIAGLKALLSSRPEFEIISCFTDLSHYLERAATLRSDVLLLNPTLIDYQKRLNIRSLLPASPNLLLFALVYNYVESETIKQYDGIIEITDDATVIARKFKQAADSNQSGADVGDNYELSEREIEILTSVAKGMTNKEIADLHNISIHTVISHRKNITRKTGIKTVSGLTVYALINNLIDQSDIE